MGKSHPFFDRSEKTLGTILGMIASWLDQHMIPLMDQYPTTMIVGGIILAFCAIGVTFITGPVWPAFAAVPAIATSVATMLRYDATH